MSIKREHQQLLINVSLLYWNLAIFLDISTLLLILKFSKKQEKQFSQEVGRATTVEHLNFLRRYD